MQVIGRGSRVTARATGQDIEGIVISVILGGLESQFVLYGVSVNYSDNIKTFTVPAAYVNPIEGSVTYWDVTIA